MMAKWYSGTLGPKASWQLSYRWGKPPKKTSPRKLVLTGDRTQARCMTGVHATIYPTAVDYGDRYGELTHEQITMSMASHSPAFVLRVTWRKKKWNKHCQVPPSSGSCQGRTYTTYYPYKVLILKWKLLVSEQYYQLSSYIQNINNIFLYVTFETLVWK